VRYGTTISDSSDHCLYRIAALSVDCDMRPMRRIRVIGGMLSLGGIAAGSSRILGGQALSWVLLFSAFRNETPFDKFRKSICTRSGHLRQKRRLFKV
jgi:hypothetical protein